MNPNRKYDSAIIQWLYVLAGFVFVMVLVGGLTRLTNSGLSMVDWRPISGVLPPLSETDWQASFEAYKQTPEFIKVNVHFDLSDYKSIFWLEYLHRLLGRTIGLVFIVPFLYFLKKGAVTGQRLPIFLGLLFFGGLQGVVGWWMVKSGLVNRPDVSHLRLAVHLSLAAALMVSLLWVALSLQHPAKAQKGPFSLASLLIGLLTFSTLVIGAFVAGLDAGKIYNTFPLMGDHFVPEGLTTVPIETWIDNPIAVQFVHRCAAITTVLVILATWIRTRKTVASEHIRRSAQRIALIALLQFCLGIATLINFAPLNLALAHQACAFLLLAAITHFVFICWHSPPQPEA